MTTQCPHCGGKVQVTLSAPAPEPPIQRQDDWLEPSIIAYRMGCTDAHVRRLCERGRKLGISGIEKRGGRWFATFKAVEDARNVRI